MVGKDGLNSGWFDAAAAKLRSMGHEVFSPADHDRKMGFEPKDFKGRTFDDLAASGFDRRAALLADWTWIGHNSEGMVAGPDWMNSPGTLSEIVCHQALFLPVWEYDAFVNFYGDDEPLKAMILPPIMELGGSKPHFSQGVGWI
jgi:hypothetical protein